MNVRGNEIDFPGILLNNEKNNSALPPPLILFGISAPSIASYVRTEMILLDSQSAILNCQGAACHEASAIYLSIAIRVSYWVKDKIVTK